MSHNRILYVCTLCDESGNPEFCGRFDPKELAVLPGDVWVCDCCYDELSREDLGLPADDDALKPSFESWPRPPAYVPAPATAL